jgi:hypothetical protein
MKKKISIHRVNPDKYYGMGMFRSSVGGYVPYVDYCIKVSGLQKEISRLKDTIVNVHMKEAGIS